jgi:hypothetical protein
MMRGMISHDDFVHTSTSAIRPVPICASNEALAGALTGHSTLLLNAGMEN